MRLGVVMDTNVAVVANGKADHAGRQCEESCVNKLLEMREHHRVFLDEQGGILEEYRRYLSPSGQPGVGDSFFKWLWDNQGNPVHCRKVPITPTSSDRRFEEFPDDTELAGFDPSDRKFVAVAIASQERPPILNAADTDWWAHRTALKRHGLEIQFLCPELMKRKS